MELAVPYSGQGTFFALPTGFTVQSVTVNGSPVAYSVSVTGVTLSAAPALRAVVEIEYDVPGQPVNTTPASQLATYSTVSAAGNALAVQVGDTLVVNRAGASSTVDLTVPTGGPGRVTVANGDGLSPAEVSALHRPPAIRMGNSGSSIVLPSVSLSAAADSGWTLGALVRINVENLQAGTTHLRFLQIGTAPAYAMLGYEGPNATNPFVMKALMPNAALNGVVSLRQGLNSVWSPFHSNRLGQWAWIFLRKHPAALTENVLSLSTGLEISANFTDETITLAWAPPQTSDPTGTVVYAGSSGIAAASFGAATAALTVGPDASNTGSFDVAKVFFLNQFLNAQQLGRMAMGKRPQDLGLTVNNSTDVYYDLTSGTAANLLDLAGGTPATSVTLTGGDAVTPVGNRPTVFQYMGSTGNTKLDVVFSDQLARAV